MCIIAKTDERKRKVGRLGLQPIAVHNLERAFLEYGLLGAVLTAGGFVCSKGNHKKGLFMVIHNVAERRNKVP